MAGARECLCVCVSIGCSSVTASILHYWVLLFYATAATIDVNNLEKLLRKKKHDLLALMDWYKLLVLFKCFIYNNKNWGIHFY